MAVKGFTFWLTYWDVAQELDDQQQGEFYKAICDYMFSDQDLESELSPIVRICFKAIKANLKTSKKQSKNGQKAKTKPNESQLKAKQNPTQSQTEAKSKQVKDKGKYKDKYKGQNDGNATGKQMPEACRAELIELGVIRA